MQQLCGTTHIWVARRQRVKELLFIIHLVSYVVT
jgi:hypothetical protein